jgi:hypothetical protein
MRGFSGRGCSAASYQSIFSTLDEITKPCVGNNTYPIPKETDLN